MASFIPVLRNFQITDIYHRMYNRVLPCNYTFRGEKHNFWEIEYVVDGQMEMTEDENVYIMKDGDIIFHSPMEFHRMNNSNAAHLINLSFKASGDFSENLTDGFFSLDENEIAFADYATVNVCIGSRKILPTQPVISWSEAPSNLGIIKFKFPLAGGALISGKKESDGIYFRQNGLVISVK